MQPCKAVSPLFQVQAYPKNLSEEQRRQIASSEEEKFENQDASLDPKIEEGINEGKWTDEEHEKFVEGLKLFGKNWNLIRKHVGTRTCPQTRSHAQKFFRKLEKTGEMEQFRTQIAQKTPSEGFSPKLKQKREKSSIDSTAPFSGIRNLQALSP